MGFERPAEDLAELSSGDYGGGDGGGGGFEVVGCFGEGEGCEVVVGGGSGCEEVFNVEGGGVGGASGELDGGGAIGQHWGWGLGVGGGDACACGGMK